MSKEEIIHGLKNAIERGSSLEAAKKSFINAGYDSREIEEAANFVGGGIMTQYPQLSHSQQYQQPPQYPPQKHLPQRLPTAPPRSPQLPQQQTSRTPNQLQRPQQQKPRSKAGIIILLIFLVLLITALVVSFVFREKILDFFTNLF